MSQSLTSKTISGVKWTTLSTIILSLLQIGYGAVIARLLDPTAFGLVAMSNVFLRFGGYFTNMGMAQAIIQKEKLSNEEIRSAFTSSQLLGIIFTGLFWFIAPFARNIFNSPEVVPVIRAMAFSFILTGLASTSQALIKRSMNFRSITLIEVVSYFVGYVLVGISSALMGYGVWSLVFAILTQSAMSTILSFAIARHSLKLLFSWQHYKPMLAFGGQVSSISFIQFISSNLDTILIGKLLGEALLGIYNRTITLVMLPMNYIGFNFSKVLYPAFSKIQHDLDKIKDLYTSTMSLSLSVLLPVAFGMIAAGEEIVLVLLGDKWMETIPVFRVLMITIAFSYVTHISGIIIQVTNRMKFMLILETGYLVVFSLLLILLSKFGLKGVSWAVMTGWFLRCMCYVLLMKQILRFNYGHVVKAYLVNIVASCLVFLGVYFTRQMFHQYVLWILFPAEVIAGIISYLIVFKLLITKLFNQEIIFWLNKTDQSKSNPILRRIKLMIS